MAQPKKSASSQLAELRRENARLKAELKLKNGTNPKKRGNIWLTALVVLCAGIAGALLVAGNILFWAGQTIVNTDRYVAAVGPLVQQPEIQKAVATKATTELFKQVNVEQLAAKSLPPRAQFLAGPLSERVQSFANDKALAVVSSQEFENIWYSVNQQAHQRTVDAIKNSTSDGTINVSDVYNRLSQRLQAGPLAFLSGKKLPENIGSIEVLEVSWLPTARWVVNNLNTLRWVTIAAFLLLSAAAIVLSRDRRKTTVRLGIIYALVMIATLFALNITKQITLNRVMPEYQAAVGEAWQTITGSLVLQTAGLALLGLIMALLAWLAGSSRSARATKNRLEAVMSGKFHSSIFKKENAVTHWIGSFRTQLIWISVAVAGVTLLFVQLKPRVVFSTLLYLTLVILVIELLAAPRNK